MILDANTPGVETQLGTPNMDFAGPGIGAGGSNGQPGQNAIAKGTVLIVSDDNNPVAPLSYTGTSLITFTFDDLVNTKSIELLNVAVVGWQIELFDIDNNSIQTIVVPILGYNSIQTLKKPLNIFNLFIILYISFTINTNYTKKVTSNN